MSVLWASALSCLHLKAICLARLCNTTNVDAPAFFLLLFSALHPRFCTTRHDSFLSQKLTSRLARLLAASSCPPLPCAMTFPAHAFLFYFGAFRECRLHYSHSALLFSASNSCHLSTCCRITLESCCMTDSAHMTSSIVRFVSRVTFSHIWVHFTLTVPSFFAAFPLISSIFQHSSPAKSATDAWSHTSSHN